MLCRINCSEYKAGYRKTMKKMNQRVNSDNENEVEAVNQLKSLVKKALQDRRHEKSLQLKGQRRQRQTSLTAVFSVASIQKDFVNRLHSHREQKVADNIAT